jgi:hypothetical protein
MEVAMRALRIPLALVFGGGLALLASACGGGGGGTTAQPIDARLFAGTYSVSFLSLDDGAPDTGRAWWGTGIADGAGSWTPTIGQNANGVIQAPATLPPFSYTVGSDRTWAWQEGSVDVLRGGISADGRVVTAATIVSGGTPTFLTLVRREGSFGLGSLNGVYHLCALVYDHSAPELDAWWGTATFDGAGGVTFAYALSEDGVIAPPTGGPTTYTVAADGATTLAAPPPAVYEGGILLGGDLVILSGSSTATRDPGMMILIRQGSGLGPASAMGTYFLAGASRGGGGGGFESVTGPATFDGAGSVSVTLTRNDDGVITTDPPQTVGYAIAGNGAFTVNAGGDLFQGAISPDGRFAMISGETTGSGNPQINFLLK